MSRKDRSLEQIDIVKLLLFLLIFVVISMSMIFALIVPDIKTFKRAKAEHRSQFMTTSRVENILGEKEKELKQLSSENLKILDAFVNSFDETRFIKYTSQFFEEVTLMKVKKEEMSDQKEFMMYELNVTSTLKSPSNFYAFLEGLNRYENIVKADFPIEMQAEDGYIRAQFSIKVYELERK